MPVYSKVNEFMVKVRVANPHYERHKNSSLHVLVKLLGQNSTADQVRTAIGALPADKKTKYADALSYLRATFPGLGAAIGVAGPAMLNTAGVTLAAVRTAPTAKIAPPVPPRVGEYTVMQAAAPTRNFFLVHDPEPVAPTLDAMPPLTRPEVERLNEAVDRTKRAVEQAVEFLRKVTVLRTAVPTAEQSLYNDLFGAYDAQRHKTVRDNFLAIDAVLGGTRGGAKGSLFLIDSRNDAQKWTWYAATFRNSAQNGKVRLYIGRAFFTRGGYSTSTDGTVGTIVHELAHAVFGASDVPTVESGLSLNANGMPPANALVCNDLEADKTLAARSPDLAVRNADNYGQFARLALAQSGG